SPRSPHSFPTRRSSDLKNPALKPSGRSGFRQAVSGAANRLNLKGAARLGNASEDQDRAVDDILTDDPAVPAGTDQFFPSDDLTRSEEHTSELQSRSDLV